METYSLEAVNKAVDEYRTAAVINPREQPGVNQVELARDLQKLKEKQEDRSKNLEPRQKDAERLKLNLGAVLHDAATRPNSGWLGRNASVSLASDYDRILNDVHVVAEIPDEGSEKPGRMIMGMDLATVLDVKKRVDWILKDITGDDLTDVKYYKSGSLQKIPRLVIALEDVGAQDLVKAWSQKNPSFSKDSTWKMMLTELIDQCEQFSAYAKTNQKSAIAEAYKNLKTYLEDVYGGKITEEARRAYAKNKAFTQLEVAIHQPELEN